MGKIPLKLFFSILQIRSFQTEASGTRTPTLKLAAVAEISSKRKTKAATLKSGKKPNTVVNFLKSQQFSDTQIAKLVELYPAVVRCKVAKNLKPKFKFFKENGFKSTLLTELILRTPPILRRSLNAHLKPSVEYLKTLLVENNEMNLVLVLRRANWLLTLNLRNNLQPKIDMLLQEGVPIDNIKKLFTSQPRCLLCTGDKMVYGIEMVKKFGIKPNERKFIHALRVFLTWSESKLRKKMEFMKSLGWSDEDIISTVVRQPFFVMCSEGKLKATMEFLVNTMNVKPVTVISYPKLVMYSLEKRTVPRCKVLLALQEKRLVKELMLPSVINMREEEFVSKYIVKYQKQFPDLLTLFQRWKLDGVPIQQ